MTTTIAVSMPKDAYLQTLRVLGAWWRLGSSALNPDLLIERAEARAFRGAHAPCDAPTPVDEERQGHPVKDAVAAGGWRNEQTLLTSYGMW